jgi:hypothetical protein
MVFDRLNNLSILFLLVPALFVFAGAVWLTMRSKKERSRDEIETEVPGWASVLRSVRIPVTFILWLLVFGVVIGTIVYFYINWSQFGLALPVGG